MMNIFENVKRTLPDEEFLELASSEHIKIERIVSTGHRSPEGFWYDQVVNEWVLVLAGQGIIEYEDDHEVILDRGDYLHIPAHQKHRIKETSSTEPTVWLAVHYK